MLHQVGDPLGQEYRLRRQLGVSVRIEHSAIGGSDEQRPNLCEAAFGNGQEPMEIPRGETLEPLGDVHLNG